MNNIKIALLLSLITVPAHAMLAPLARATARIPNSSYTASLRSMSCQTPSTPQLCVKESYDPSCKNCLANEKIQKQQAHESHLNQLNNTQNSLAESQVWMGFGSMAFLSSVPFENIFFFCAGIPMAVFHSAFAFYEAKQIQKLQATLNASDYNEGKNQFTQEKQLRETLLKKISWEQKKVFFNRLGTGAHSIVSLQAALLYMLKHPYDVSFYEQLPKIAAVTAVGTALHSYMSTRQLTKIAELRTKL